MDRYECTDGNAQKFWEVECNENQLTTRYGKIGGKPQEKIKKFPSEDDAQKEYEKLVREKLKKGYTLVSSESDGSPANLINQEIENAIALDPDNDRLYRDYSIWQQRNGMVRGELAQFFSPKPDPKKFNTFMKKHAEELVGKKFAKMSHRIANTASKEPLSLTCKDQYITDKKDNQHPICFAWHYGYIRSARIAMNYDTWNSQEWGTHPDKKVLEEYLRLESAKFTRYLTLGCFNFEGEQGYKGTLSILSKTENLPYLEGLFLGDFDQEDCELSWSNLGDAGLLSERFPKLQTLILRSGDIFVSRLVFPELRKFVLISGGLPKGALKGLKAHQCPKLTHLEIYLGTEDYGAECSIEDLSFIFKGDSFKNVKFLGLKNSEHQGDMVKAILKAPILKQLEVLDFSMGTLQDKEAEILLKNPDKFAHLKLLNLSENGLTKSGVNSFKKFSCPVKTELQKDSSWCYVSIGE